MMDLTGWLIAQVYAFLLKKKSPAEPVGFTASIDQP